MAGFLDVILRGLILAAQAVAVGGVCFMLLVLRPWGARPVDDPVTTTRSLRLIALGAIALAIGQALAQRFPPEPDEQNELPDALTRV